MNGVILIRGESFRLGGQFSRKIGDSSVINDQILASKSQKRLVDNLVSQGNSIKVAIDTVSTKFDYELKNIFGEDAHYNFKLSHDISQYLGLQNALDKIDFLFDENIDFLLILRNDLFLRDEFYNIFSVNDSVLKFPSVCWYENRKLASGLPRTNDTIFFIPKIYLGLRKTFRAQGFKDGHDLLDLWTKMIPDLRYDFYLDTYHDSNTIHDWNPLYKMIGREESLVMRSDKNLRYPSDF